MHHDDVVRRAIEIVAATDENAVAATFLASLSSRNLAARSAFGAYVVLQHLAEHEHTPSTFAGPRCGLCRLHDDVTLWTEPELAVRQYQFYPTDLTYALPALEGFPARAAKPTEDDHEVLGRILDAVRALPPAAGLTDLDGVARGRLASNRRERTWLMETLGYAGILCPVGRRHYSAEFVPADFADSEYPARQTDWQYPIRFWTGADGVNEQMVARYFGG